MSDRAGKPTRSQAGRTAARLKGSGAVAQDGGTALSKRAAQVGGNLSGNLNTGLQLIVHQYLAPGPAELDDADITQQVRQYLDWLRAHNASITLRGIDRSGGSKTVDLPLKTAYVPLRARPQARPGEPDGGGPGRRPDAGEAKRPRRGIKMRGSGGVGDDATAERAVSLDQLLSLGQRLAVIGGPGSGKTTVLRHMAWALAASLLDGQAEPARSRLGLAPPADLPLPLLVPLAAFARYRRDLPANSPAQQRTLRHYISYHLISQQAAFRLPADFFERLLDAGRPLLLLLDGLDEVAVEAERHAVRQQVEQLVQGSTSLRVVVTCRTVAFRQGRTALAADFREVLVQPLDFDNHVVPMVRQAYASMHAHDAARRDKRANDLLNGIRQLESDRMTRGGGRAVEPLVASPLMVRLLLIVHESETALPDQRADLFDKAIEALLQVDYGPDEEVIHQLSVQWQTLLDLAQHLAWHMHGQGPEQGREIDEAALTAVLRQDELLAPHADTFIAHARQRGSLVEERDGAYRFVHLALQEFLVARHLREVVAGTRGLPALVSELQGKLVDPWWREPILLALGYRSGRAARTVRELVALLRDTAPHDTADVLEQALGAAELVGTAVADWPDSGAPLRQTCAERLLALLSDDATLLGAPPKLRARAGDALSRLGDPRFDAARFHLPTDDNLGLVFIAQDPCFMIGTRKQDVQRVEQAIGRALAGNEMNEAVTPSPDFYIARFPVTVAQFRAFVDDTGFDPGNADALLDADSRPVRFVSWSEAQAYCEWLHRTLAEAPALAGTRVAALVRDQGWQLTLPSEREWEKAARGGRVAQVFPWGDAWQPQRANTDDSGIGDTCAVGCFAPNDYGLYDMAGNVLEWTLSPWKKKYDAIMLQAEVVEPASDEALVVRGGSWKDIRVFARCAVRGWYFPVDRYFSLGFRVVLRASPCC